MHKIWRATIMGIKFMLVVFMVVIVVSTSYGVITRYVLNAAAVWTNELATYLLIWVTFLGSALAVIEGGHMNVDFVLEMLPPAPQKAFRLIGNLFLIGFVGILTYHGTTVAISSAADRALTIPISKGLFYAAVPVGSLIMVIGYVLETVKLFKKVPQLQGTTAESKGEVVL